MELIYYTLGNETLDYICWRHYVCNDLITKNAEEFSNPIFNAFLKSYEAEDSGINGIIEKVLEANPGICDYPTLPAGIKIALPLIEETPVDLTLTDLWD